MHTTELIASLTKKNRRPQRLYTDALREILAGIQQALSDGKEVVLTGFGTFYTRTHKGGRGINFKTRKAVEYKPLRQAAFRPGRLLKLAVRRKK